MIPYLRQCRFPIRYDDLDFDEGLVLDVLADKLIICELKSVEKVNTLWQAQLLSHLHLLHLHVGFIINFNVLLIKAGIRRFCIH